MLFGFPHSAGDSAEWREAASAVEPLLAGAEVSARLRGATHGVVALGHDDSHLAECKAWLLDRKRSDDVFDKVVATDLSTLLELSKARDLAVAQGMDDNGNTRYLPILIQGDTGVGKELVAVGIHALWKRATKRPDAPFQVMQVAGLPPDLVNDELFGHVRGAYTGADKERIGRIEAAAGGTLLIDEVGDLPPEAQLRLLRFLQTQKMSRTGENKEQQVQVRILAATWRNLETMVAEGQFRKDLFYRLRFGTSLALRPLVEREGFFEDVVPRILEKRGQRAQPPLTHSAHAALALHKWPGNLRELVGVLEEALSLAQGGTLRLEHLPAHLQRPYLAQPLYDRAPAFLADELEHQELTEEHVRWRVIQVENSAMGALQQIPPDPELEKLSKFLKSLGENAPENQQTVQAISELMMSGQEHRRQSLLAGFWEELARCGLPEVVSRVLREKEAQSKKRVAELQQQHNAIGLRAKTQLDQNPWMNLMGEIKGLPVMADVQDEQVSEFIGFIFKILQSFMPSGAERLREEVRKGNLLQRLRDQADASNRDDKGNPGTLGEGPLEPIGTERKKAADLSRDEWVELTKLYPTQAKACEATGYDPKTISKYLSQHGIPNPWTRAGG